MRIISDDGSTKDLTVYSHGYINYDGKTFIGNRISEMTSHELALCNIQTDVHGEYYVQKGGQKRLFLTNAILTDKNGITVRDYLKTVRPMPMRIIFEFDVMAPDADYAKIKAEDYLRDNINNITPIGVINI